jgi:hypothetical protein
MDECAGRGHRACHGVDYELQQLRNPAVDEVGRPTCCFTSETANKLHADISNRADIRAWGHWNGEDKSCPTAYRPC